MTTDLSWLSRTQLLIGEMTIIDGDVVDPTNRNRQLPALATNHGISKAAIMAERLKAINPELDLNVIDSFIRPEQVLDSLASQPTYLIDAIDSITPKITFIKTALERKIPLVSSMGAGAKLDPTRLQVVDISETYNCPFAQQIRKQLKSRYGIRKGLEVVFSPDEPIKKSLMLTDGKNFKKSAYGTISYLPAVFGAVCASVAIRDMIV
ncbi:MAG: tRNA threonylcarbamoyladenosine dehydratase [Bacteroidetes bacterium]|nr:tRNA threonylcarbamoyladenosine dehydratase [Bacteroidota bacterium]